MRKQLEDLETVLAQHGESQSAGMVALALRGSDQELQTFLVSNELWGGSGSIADQAGLEHGRTAGRRSIEAALIRLGSVQVQEGMANARTTSWVDAFRSWQDEGI